MVFSRGAVLDERVDGASMACKRGKARRQRFASVRELPQFGQTKQVCKPCKPTSHSAPSVLVASHRQRSLRQSIYDISGAKAAAKARRAQKWIDEQLEIRRIYRIHRVLEGINSSLVGGIRSFTQGLLELF